MFNTRNEFRLHQTLVAGEVAYMKDEMKCHDHVDGDDACQLRAAA